MEQFTTNTLSVRELLSTAYLHIDKNEYEKAIMCFESIINLLPDERLGYIGKASILQMTPCSWDEHRKLILTAKYKNSSSEYDIDIKRIIDFAPENGITLIRCACGQYDYEAVEALIYMGADIHKRTALNSTCLWRVCALPIPKGKEFEGRKIANLLLNHGAEIDITCDTGVNLYNKDTDKVIARMLKSKCASLKKGKHANTNETKQTKNTVTKILIIFMSTLLGIAVIGACFSLSCLFSLLGAGIFYVGIYCTLACVNPNVETHILHFVGAFLGIIIGVAALGTSIFTEENTFIMIINIGTALASFIGAFLIFSIYIKNMHE